jgi:hypothetical protein
MPLWWLHKTRPVSSINTCSLIPSLKLPATTQYLQHSECKIKGQPSFLIGETKLLTNNNLCSSSSVCHVAAYLLARLSVRTYIGSHGPSIRDTYLLIFVPIPLLLPTHMMLNILYMLLQHISAPWADSFPSSFTIGGHYE